MALSAVLVEVTPYRLQYLISQSGNEALNEQLVIPNAAGPTPDLRTDARTFKNSAMDNLVSQPIALLDNAAAAKFLDGDGLIAVLQIEVIRSHLKITPRNLSGAPHPGWSVTAQEGSVLSPASSGFAIVVVNGPGFAGETAYLDIDFEHTFDR